MDVWDMDGIRMHSWPHEQPDGTPVDTVAGLIAGRLIDGPQDLSDWTRLPSWVPAPARLKAEVRAWLTERGYDYGPEGPPR